VNLVIESADNPEMERMKQAGKDGGKRRLTAVTVWRYDAIVGFCLQKPYPDCPIMAER